MHWRIGYWECQFPHGWVHTIAVVSLLLEFRLLPNNGRFALHKFEATDFDDRSSIIENPSAKMQSILVARSVPDCAPLILQLCVPHFCSLQRSFRLRFS